MPAERRQVAAGAAHRGGIDVGGVQFRVRQRGGERGAERARTAAQVHDDDRGGGVRERQRLLDEEFGASARDEDPGVHGHPKTVEPGPAQDVFEG